MKRILFFLTILAFLAASLPAEAQSRRKSRKAKKTEQQAKPEVSPQKQETPLRQEAPFKENKEVTQPTETIPDNDKERRPSQPQPTPSVFKPEEVIRESTPIVETKPNGSVNWTEQYVEARGESVIDTERFKNTAQARAMAQRGAVVVAQRNLLEIINGVHVTGETTVKDMIATSDYIYTRVDGVIKGAQMVGEPIEKDGLIIVTMRVPLYQTDGLAAVLHDEVVKKRGEQYRVADAENTGGINPEALAFNLGGKKIDPALFPIIVDENGNLLLDMSKVYDPKKGVFPKILQVGKNILSELGITKGVEVIDVISAENGKIVIDNKHVKKIDWKKVGSVAASIGKFLLMFI